MSNAGTITTLTNSGAISGGSGGSGALHGGGSGGAGMSNSGTITTLTNSGTISGGNAGGGTAMRGRRGRRGRVELRHDHDSDQQRRDQRRCRRRVDPSGAGVTNALGAMIGSLTNRATGAIAAETAASAGRACRTPARSRR